MRNARASHSRKISASGLGYARQAVAFASIVTVPTPIDDVRRPDLCAMLDRAGKQNGIILWRL